MTGPSFSRRAVLTSAGVAAIGLAVGDVQATPVEVASAPHLPASILLRSKLSDDRLKDLRALSTQLTMGHEIPLADATVIFGGVSADELQAAKKLRWVQCPSAGVEHYPLAAMGERDVVLTNGQGCYAPEIAEHAFGLLFALTRGIATHARQTKWGYDRQPIELRGMTLGIVGLGGIGREVARRGKAMDMHVIAVDAEPMYGERFAMVEEVRLVDDGLDDLLKRSDVVVSCAPHTPRSRGMFGAEQFAMMRKGSYFINVSRGKLVKSDALLGALESGQLAGAGLDVTDPEPLPEGHPLWSQANVVVTSHIAGKSQFSYERVQNVFAQNVLRYVKNLPLLNVVDKAKGY
jgi:phosphoglycerate dehydrogenase-like enzyme